MANFMNMWRLTGGGVVASLANEKCRFREFIKKMVKILRTRGSCALLDISDIEP